MGGEVDAEHTAVVCQTEEGTDGGCHIDLHCEPVDSLRLNKGRSVK